MDLAHWTCYSPVLKILLHTEAGNVNHQLTPALPYSAGIY